MTGEDLGIDPNRSLTGPDPVSAGDGKTPGARARLHIYGGRSVPGTAPAVECGLDRRPDGDRATRSLSRLISGSSS
jgi:hypothetical protein